MGLREVHPGVPDVPPAEPRPRTKLMTEPQRACWIPGSLNGEGVVASRAGLRGALCGRDLERTRREVLKHSDPQRATVPTILGPA